MEKRRRENRRAQQGAVPWLRTKWGQLLCFWEYPKRPSVKKNLTSAVTPLVLTKFVPLRVPLPVAADHPPRGALALGRAADLRGSVSSASWRYTHEGFPFRTRDSPYRISCVLTIRTYDSRFSISNKRTQDRFETSRDHLLI